MKLNKSNPSLIGFLQALGVVAYCALIGGFFQLGNRFFIQQSVFWITVLILILLVFSAAITGTIVFGYPAYLALNKRVKEALSIFFYTLLYSLGIIGIIIIFITVF